MLYVRHILEMHTTIRKCSFQRANGGNQHMRRRSSHRILQANGRTEEVMRNLPAWRSLGFLPH